MRGRLSSGARRLGAYVALLVVVYAAYGGTLRQSFVADDFTNLRFVRGLDAPLYRYLDPTFGFSEPVTRSRYLPVRLFFLLFLERRFGLDPMPYHALALALHALGALLVGHLGRVVWRSRTVGAIAALTFALTRLNAQNVCWMVCLPNLLGTVLVLASVGLYLRRPEGAALRCAGPVLLAASLLCRTDGIVAIVFLAPLWVKDAGIERRRDARVFAVATLCLASAIVLASLANLRAFPEPRMELGLSPRRFGAFLLDVFAPFEAPVAAKGLLLAALLAASTKLRDRRVHYALYGLALGAAWWSVLVYLDLTPRYFYLYAALSSMVLAALARAAFAALLRQRSIAVQRLAALGAAACAAAWSGHAIRTRDVVWFDYLSVPGHALLALEARERAAGAPGPLRVRMDPYPLLIDSDFAFFAPTLEIVKDGPAEVVVHTGAARYEAYYGASFGRAFWFFPWFVR